MKGNLLVLASAALERAGLEELLRAEGHGVLRSQSADIALAQIRDAAPDALLFWHDPGDEESVRFLRDAREAAEHTALVALVDEGDLELVALAIRAGADFCLALPLRPDSLRALIERALEKPELARQAVDAEERAVERLDIGNFGRIVGSHPAMQLLLQKVLQAARSRATVLISGETGTGKELIAAAIHENSRRAGGPLVRVNCSALAESVLESELFGHEKGAFTGATSQRRGRFEEAAGGTLFLDEVSEIPKPLQVKLLRFLQEREFERVGSSKTRKVDVRIVAASNRSLKAMVSDGAFRSDLYYRLNVVRLEVPPLRLRPSDIPILAEHFLRHFSELEEKELRGFCPDAIRLMLDYPWPGNVRELQNAVEQAVVLATGDEIGPDDLPLTPSESQEVEPLRLMIPGVTLAEVERYTILKTLEAVGGSPSKAAKILGISRRTMQYRLRDWGLSKPRAKGKPSTVETENEAGPEA